MFKHPLHPALVHFPIATWTLATAADFAALRYGQAAWSWSAGLLTVGCLMTLPAMLAGMIELMKVPEGGAPSRDAHLHMGLMLGAFSFYLCSLVFRLQGSHALPPDSTSLILDALGFACLALGGWLGARLVYQHGIGGSRTQQD